MSCSPNRPLIAMCALIATTALAAPALAEPTVTTTEPSETSVNIASTGAGTRQLEVLTLTGEPLSVLDMAPGAPSPFRVRVTDEGVGQLAADDGTIFQNAGFTVQAVMNNLYPITTSHPTGNPDADSFIPAEDIDITFGNGALTSNGTVAALLDGALLGSLTCDQIEATLGVNILTLLTSLDLTEALLGDLLDGVCDALGSGLDLGVSGVPLSSSLEKVSEAVDALPFALGGQSPFSFVADYESGVGAGDDVRVTRDADGRATGVTREPKTLLSAQPSETAGAGTLGDMATDASGLPLVSGTAGLATLQDVVASLAAAGHGALAAALSDLAEHDLAKALQIVNLLDGVVSAVGLDDVTDVTGQYNSFPIMKIDPSGPVADGTYSGTMTVTLIQP